MKLSVVNRCETVAEALESLQQHDTSYQIAADYEAMMRYLVVGRIMQAYLPAVLMKMCLGGASNQSLRHMIQKSREDYRAIRQHNIGGLGTLVRKNFSNLGQFLRTDKQDQ